MTSEKADWVKIKPEELKKLVIELAKKGESPAKIGLILRDKHGIPKAKLLGKRISEILEEAKIPYNSEKDALKKKIEKITKHIEKNKHDKGARRPITKALWKLRDIELQAKVG